MFNGRPKQNKRNILCITCVHLYLHALQFHLKNATANWAPLLCLISCSQPSPLTTSRGGEVNMAACNSEREIALIFTAQNLWGKKRERGSVHFHSFYFRFFRSISELHPLHPHPFVGDGWVVDNAGQSDEVPNDREVRNNSALWLQVWVWVFLMRCRWKRWQRDVFKWLTFPVKSLMKMGGEKKQTQKVVVLIEEKSVALWTLRLQCFPWNWRYNLLLWPPCCVL